MPQLDLYGGSNRSTISWSYSINPLRPHDPAMFYVTISGGRGAAIEYGLMMCPLNVIHEGISKALIGSWEAYLFGEVDDVRKVIGKTSKWAKIESLRRPGC